MICPICGEETPVLLLVDAGNGLQQMCRHCKSLRRQIVADIEGSIEDLRPNDAKAKATHEATGLQPPGVTAQRDQRDSEEQSRSRDIQARRAA